MKTKKIYYTLLVVLFFSFSSIGEEIKKNKKTDPLDKKADLNLVCTPKEEFKATILTNFSSSSVYDPDEVRVWYGDPSKFIPTEIQFDENDIEIMKGAMFAGNRRQSYIQSKDGSEYTYDIYTLKNEWNCITKNK